MTSVPVAATTLALRQVWHPFRIACMTAVAGVIAAPAMADSIPVVTYARANGNGQAIGGAYSYCDVAYTGTLALLGLARLGLTRRRKAV